MPEKKSELHVHYNNDRVTFTSNTHAQHFNEQSFVKWIRLSWRPEIIRSWEIKMSCSMESSREIEDVKEKVSIQFRLWSPHSEENGLDDFLGHYLQEIAKALCADHKHDEDIAVWLEIYGSEKTPIHLPTIKHWSHLGTIMAITQFVTEHKRKIDELEPC